MKPIAHHSKRTEGGVIAIMKFRLIDTRKKFKHGNQQAREHDDDDHSIFHILHSKVRKYKCACEYVSPDGIDEDLDQDGEEAGSAVSCVGG
mmetsp:Transcript_12752/g.22374  ORF Transcript_12752/g.22374 Transcript_12752/m.22374 type:complete len:91 (-) Transcript_12752:1144-1416(-)